MAWKVVRTRSMVRASKWAVRLQVPKAYIHVSFLCLLAIS